MNARNESVAHVTDREITLTRVFDAPRDLVFQVWTDPVHTAQWWGPRGFSTTTHKMELKPGGVWRYDMHGPDGRDYGNIITFLEVAKPSKLVYKHGGDKDLEPVNFQVTVTFDTLDGDPRKTRVTMKSVFPSAAAFEYVVKTYGAVEGGKQHLARLEEHLQQLSDAAQGRSSKPFVISRVFNAPRELVYKVWTEREHLMKWFGPKGVTMPSATMDLRPGGMFHYAMKSADGKVMWGRWVFREIVPPERLTVIVSFSDEKGGITRAPFEGNWPLETLSTMTFSPHAGMGGGTVVTVTWTAINATAIERKTFEDGFAGMTMGWTGTMEQLDAYLAAIGGSRPGR